MTEYISKRFVKRLSDYQLVEENEMCEYEYLTQVLVEKIIGFGLLMLVSLFNHLLLQTICFLLFFANLRKFSGGFHAKSFLGCVSLSLIVHLGYIKLIFPILLNRNWLNTYLVVGAVVIIFLVGAVNHPNMHWNEEEYRMNRTAARVVCIIESGIIIVLTQLEVSLSYILFMSFGLILSAIMIFVAKIIRQEVR